MSYKPAVNTQVLQPLPDEYFRQVTGVQLSEYWYLMRFGRVTSTGAIQILALGSDTPTVREEAIDTKAAFQSAGLRLQGTSAPSGVLERLIAVWLRRTLGGGRMEDALQIGRINEPKPPPTYQRF